MATGTDLNPCQVIDHQLRWLVTQGELENSVYVGAGGAQPCTLQTRKLIKDDSGNKTWSEWKNVRVETP